MDLEVRQFSGTQRLQRMARLNSLRLVRVESNRLFSRRPQVVRHRVFGRIGKGKDQTETAVWDLQSRRAVRRAHQRGTSVVASPDRRVLATGVFDYSDSSTTTKVSLHDLDYG